MTGYETVATDFIDRDGWRSDGTEPGAGGDGRARVAFFYSGGG